jgi:hypothetical protein
MDAELECHFCCVEFPCVTLHTSEAPGIDLSTGAVVERGREEDLLQVVALWSEELVEVILRTRNWLAVWQRLVTCGNHIF